MPNLRKASFLASLFSELWPKKLQAHVRTETLSNGQVTVTPTFTIDGREIPAELVGPDKNQSILGYRVDVDANCQHVQGKTQGKPTRLTKRKAAEFLMELDRAGVPVRSKDGKLRPRIEVVKPDVSLVLGAGDALNVQSEISTSAGVVLEKPADLAELKKENGWYANGDDLIRVQTSETCLDELLILQGGNKTLSGDDVPRTLKLLQKERSLVGSIDKNEPLKDLSVLSEKTKNVAKVEGNAESISIHPSLAFEGKHGRQYEQTAQEVQDFEKKGGGFRRVTDGWIEVSATAAQKFGADCDELAEKLGSISDIRGTAIPKALTTMVHATHTGGEWKSPWVVYFSEAVKDAHKVLEAPARVEFRLNIVERDGRSLLELDPVYNHERYSVSHKEAQGAAKIGEKWIRRKGAWVKVDAAKIKEINASADGLGLRDDEGGFTFPASQREQVIEVFSTLGSVHHSAAYADFIQKLANFEKIEMVPLPKSLRPEISFRTYQQHGFNWLAFLQRFGLNGILADDMGLGKTLQTLAVIQRAKELGRSRLPSLIVCPTSVVNNWRSEVGKFFHNCDIVVYTGSNREKRLRHLHDLLRLARTPMECPFVVTSYNIARIDHEKLNRIPWLYVVVDEGHNIKNPDAASTKAIKTINGQHKLVLTGTPIQNNLEELWSLFDYAMPGFLGTRNAFRDLYGRNGRINWDAVRGGKTPLKDRVHPFVMRRLKKDVAPELPSKVIIHQKVDLTPKQVSLYKQVIQSPEHERLINEVAEKGVRRSKVLILAMLTRLRLICNHPVLADKDTRPVNVKHDDSGKLEYLKELMEQIVEGEHRSLLFCQSTQMLDIIQGFFKTWKVSAIRLDGSTPASRRSELVEEFNRNAEIDCFLISTKAGGTGLNLTAADTVIFYDHDWNPANDNQAQDRAHRIGQTKSVTVYKLVSKGTIEEKILERQAIKQTIADEIIGSDEEGFKDLTKEELLDLFKLDEEND